MRIEFLMPVMRPQMALLILEDLINQTLKPDKLTIVDNGGDFKLHKKYPFEIELIKPGYNIGTNQAWNKIFDIKADYIGLVPDDCRLDKNLIKILKDGLLLYNDIGASTATIFKNDIGLQARTDHIYGIQVSGKGHFGAILFKKCILDQLPLIPKEFKIFFGDNWLGWWITQIGYKIYEMSVGITHKHKTDLKVKLNYPEVIEQERIIWKQWLRCQKEL